jgi:hypothetical protein
MKEGVCVYVVVGPSVGCCVLYAVCCASLFPHSNRGQLDCRINQRQGPEQDSICRDGVAEIFQQQRKDIVLDHLRADTRDGAGRGGSGLYPYARSMRELIIRRAHATPKRVFGCVEVG